MWVLGIELTGLVESSFTHVAVWESFLKFLSISEILKYTIDFAISSDNR